MAALRNHFLRRGDVMARMLILCAWLTAWTTVGLAQDPPPLTEKVVRFEVVPKTAPKPALKYQLLPELKEMNPGNPILGYLKCFGEQRSFFHGKDELDKRDKWLAAPLADLPLKELHDYGAGPLTRADAAARLDTPDWQVLTHAKKKGVFLLLPEVQELRGMASCLKLRCRVQVAEHDFDEALATTKTTLALARHLGEHPTLIGNLVGLAIANAGLGPIEEMIGEPGCPNLFWALIDSPSPFIDIRKGVQAERLGLEPIFAGIDETASTSKANLEKAVALLDKLAKNNVLDRDVRVWLDARVKNDKYLTAARKRLVEHGLNEKAVSEFPELQVILLDEKREFEVRRDDRTKSLSLPYWKAEPFLDNTTTARADSDLLFGDVITSFNKIKRMQARLDQKIAMLAHVEALRLYAADHDGNLPAKLDDIKLPLPVDPFTGKAFVYEVSGATAIIKGTPPMGDEQNAVFNLRYVVTIKK
jgi:hypothetical protein